MVSGIQKLSSNCNWRFIDESVEETIKWEEAQSKQTTCINKAFRNIQTNEIFTRFVDVPYIKNDRHRIKLKNCLLHKTETALGFSWIYVDEEAPTNIEI